MSDEQQVQQENPLAGLGLPPSWQPAPLACLLAKVGFSTPQGNADLHLLVIDGPTGRQAFAFGEEDIRALANSILERTSGLTIAHSTADLPAQWNPQENLPPKWQS